MSNLQVSVIVPVYKAEATLDRCVESILGQAEGNYDLQVILVDDGSPDSCPQMCDQWAAKSPCVKVIHKQNGGLSDARNAGIEAAEGDCLMFVDADDYLGRQTIAPLADIMLQHPTCDLLEFPVTRLFSGGRTVQMEFGNSLYNDMQDYWLKGKAYAHSYAWNKIYRRHLFTEVRFPKGRVFEDVYTLPMLMEHTRVVATTEQGRYYYVDNAQGICNNADGDAVRMLLESHLRILPHLDLNTPLGNRYYLHVANIQVQLSYMTGERPMLERVRLQPRLFHGRCWLKAVLLNAIGIGTFARLKRTFARLRGLS